MKGTSGDVRSLGDGPDYFTAEEGILAIEETFDLEYEVESDSSDCTVSSDDSFDSDSEINIAAEVSYFSYYSSTFIISDEPFCSFVIFFFNFVVPKFCESPIVGDII